MTTKEIKAKAIRDYPIGTTFRCARFGSLDTLKSHDFKSNAFLSNVAESFIYHEKEDKWAEIISYPKGYKREEQFILDNGEVVEKNNIIVSLINVSPYREIGEMFTIKKITTSLMYYTENNNSSDRFSWRLATPTESESFIKGIKNIKDIPKELTRDQILAEAKRMYPVGTKHSGTRGGPIAGIKKPFEEIDKLIEYEIKGELYWVEDTLYSRGTPGAIYVGHNIGKEWAFITEAVEDYINQKAPYVDVMEKIKPQQEQKTTSIKIASIIISKRVKKKRRLIN